MYIIPFFCVCAGESWSYCSSMRMPDTCLARLHWVVMLPAKTLFFLTMPDCRQPGRVQKLYLLTIIIAFVWIVTLSYLMVWLVVIVGKLGSLLVLHMMMMMIKMIIITPIIIVTITIISLVK